MASKKTEDNIDNNVKSAINEIPKCTSLDVFYSNKGNSGKPYLLNGLGHGDIGYYTDKVIIDNFPCNYVTPDKVMISSWEEFFKYISDKITTASQNGRYSVNIENISFQWVTGSTEIIRMILRHLYALNYKCSLTKHVPWTTMCGEVVIYTLTISWSNIDESILNFN